MKQIVIIMCIALCTSQFLGCSESVAVIDSSSDTTSELSSSSMLSSALPKAEISSSSLPDKGSSQESSTIVSVSSEELSSEGESSEMVSSENTESSAESSSTDLSSSESSAEVIPGVANIGDAAYTLNGDTLTVSGFVITGITSINPHVFDTYDDIHLLGAGSIVQHFNDSAIKKELNHAVITLTDKDGYSSIAYGFDSDKKYSYQSFTINDAGSYIFRWEPSVEVPDSNFVSFEYRSANLERYVDVQDSIWEDSVVAGKCMMSAAHGAIVYGCEEVSVSDGLTMLLADEFPQGIVLSSSSIMSSSSVMSSATSSALSSSSSNVSSSAMSSSSIVSSSSVLSSSSVTP